MTRSVLLPMAVSFAVASLVFPLFRSLANRWNILDRPAGPLKKHDHPVPYLGGCMVFCGVAAAMALYPGQIPPELRGLILGTSLMLLVGLVDDLRPVSPYLKLACQALSAAIAVWGGLRVSIVFLPLSVNLALTCLWMVAITNAFNIIDVHDGLCSGTAVMISVGLILVSLFTTLYDKTFVTVSAAALFGAGLAFFIVNRPPARMFLGDAGSLPIGFFLAGLAIGESYTPDHPVGLFVPFLLFLVPMYDLLFVVVMRLARGLSPLRGSPDHVAVRLRHLGWSDGQVLAALLAISAISACLSPGVVFLPMPYATFLAVCAALAAIGVGWALARIRPA